ncbi:MAG: flagellar protein FlgN [Candidatus Thiodiazotropha sp. (ex Dulcina madagascariensis)]|nr:flagellar protein FlgN [Candidatus Thiodiazotropha sp. (ex Epidulcina cf. delphinae)]MCU7936369.1 flagellar protein FlgN [Candidatus Thiodiazotropha sp. (ex Dulcina madagascariensis)]
MHHSTEVEAAFSRILDIEIEQTQRLLDLLSREYELLQTSSPQSLQELLDKKKRQLETVETSVTAHNRFLEQQGFSSDRQGTEAFLQTCGDSAQPVEKWRRLITLLEACRKQNETNGGAVQLNQRHVTQALDILRGISERDKTYGPSGESKPTTTSKSLGKA